MMINSAGNPEYLIIGHVTRDLVEGGSTLGGTATYAALTAESLGKKVAILTACSDDLDLQQIEKFPIYKKPSEFTTTFENMETVGGRKQVLHHIASRIGAEDIAEKLQQPEIVHIGPVADEIDENIIVAFPDSFIGLTPQGWMRTRLDDGIVKYKHWKPAASLLKRVNAIVMSVEDVRGDEKIIEHLAARTGILAVTEGYSGARVYWHGDVRHFSAPRVSVADATGAGDIFSAAFFCLLSFSKDPWESARQSVQIASASVSKVGIKGVPTPAEMRSFQMEIVRGK